MELIVVLLSSMSGALIGTAAGIFLMYRRLRPITGAELDMLRGKLRSTEFSLDAKTANLENLKKQMAERDQAIQQNGDGLKEKQQQLDAALAAVEEGSAQRSDAERRIRELNIETAALREQLAELEVRASQEKSQVSAEAGQQLAAAQVQVQTSEYQIQELTAQVARLTGETAALKQGWDEDAHLRASLETQLHKEQEQTRELASHIAELQSELSRSDSRLREERQSAAKGIELLAMAQENFSRVLRQGSAEAAGGQNGHALVGTAVIDAPVAVAVGAGEAIHAAAATD